MDEIIFSSIIIDDEIELNSLNVEDEITVGDISVDEVSFIYENDYNNLKNKPQIEGVELKNNKTFEDLGAVSLTNIEIENLINSQI